MDRWTMQELKDTDDISFAVAILGERKKGLNPYSPLAKKLDEAARTLEEIKHEKDRFIARISGIPDACDDGEVTDFSDCDEETKRQILENAEKLDMRCEPCTPTSPECDDCEFGGVEDAS